MELIEELPMLRINFLKNMSFRDFKVFCSNKAKNEDERKKQYSILQGFCDGNIKSRGQMTRLYSYTQKTPLEVGGRLYCGNSLQGLGKQFRGFLCDGITTDIDMKNAHPVIARYLCKLNGIPCPNLNYYIENRDEVLAGFGSDGKELFLKALNDDKPNKKETSKVFKDFDKECKDIQKQITELEEYKHIVNSVPDTKIYNWLGSAFNRIMCVYENKILQSLISILNKKQIKICALCFDGLLMYGNHYDDAELLKDITLQINEQWVGLNMKWSYKQHSTDIFMPDEWVVPERIAVDENLSFEAVSQKFETNHCKIINKGVFIKSDGDDNIVMSRQHLKTAYENMTYKKEREVNGETVVENANFMESWLFNNPTQRCYNDIGVFPPGLECPSKVFNMWRPFAMESVTEYEERSVERDTILNHIKILCGNDDEVYSYLIKWIAQMIQFPAVKTICPVLISNEGAGKGTLMKLFAKMLGTSKVFETTNPSRDIWGDFNCRMANTFLINLNELSKKETLESEGRIKGLITDASLTINNKNANQYDIQSFHRFIITTNKEEPINTSKTDRRKLIIRSSDEKCGDKEYFKILHNYIEDMNVIKTMYEFFKNMNEVEHFMSIPIPETEYHEQLKELSANPIESWLLHFVTQNQDLETVELTTARAFELFNDWCLEAGVKYDCSSMQFSVRLTRLNLKGISKKKTNTCNKTVFDITILKKHFEM
jgi:hypothetical protein